MGSAPDPARPPGYPAQWEGDVVLADGGTVHVRPIRPDDGVALLRFHSRLSAESIYLRYFSPHPRLSPQEVEFLTRVDYVHRLAFVAVLGHEIVAVARYEGTPGSDDAEVAFTVEDSQQGRGIGTILLEYLAAAARENGIREFHAVTLYENRRMLGVFREIGFEVRRIVGGGEVQVRFPVDATEALAVAIARREHQAEARSVGRLLAPRSIAVVGAGRERGGIGHEVFRNLLLGDFEGSVYPVNSKAPHVAGVRAYPTVVDVPDEVDLAVVCVPAADVPVVVQQCAEKHVRGLVLIAAGFAETGRDGADRERDVVHLARLHGMRVIGPNSMGVVNTNPAVSMNATFAPVSPVPGRVAFISQSGTLGIVILEWSARTGLGISSFVSVGNKADVSSNDLLQYWEDDPGTDVVLLYLESFGNPGKFSRIARRVSRHKPIVAVKAGRGAAGTRAVRHRFPDPGDAPADSDLAVEALFRQTGVLRVATTEELFEVAQVLAHQPLPPGRRVAIVANSGGPGVLAADACEAAGLEVPELAAETQSALREALPPGAGVRNPVDLMPAAAAHDYDRALRLVLADAGVDAVIAVYTPPLPTGLDEVARTMAAVAEDAGDKPVVANFLGVEGVPEALRPVPGTVPGRGRRVIPSFPFPESAARALARAADYTSWRARPAGTFPRFDDVDLAGARAVLQEALAGDPEGAWLDPAAAARLLSGYGIPVGAAEVAGAAGPGLDTGVGLRRHPAYGALVTFTLGGMAAELVGDRALSVAPLTDRDAAEMVRSLRSAPLLTGYHGSEPVDLAALEDLLLRVGHLAEQLPEVAELVLAPVIASPAGARVAGSRIRVAPYERHPERDLRRLR